VLDLASDGLRRRARQDFKGDDETGFLASLRHIAETGRTQADDLLDAYKGRWNGSVLPVFDEYAY
jgi:glutamate--cysteine ligase